jgi:hypothetical protein
MWLALAPIAGSLMATSVADAQFTTYTNTFDNSSSFQTIANYNPPPIAVRYDYGGLGPTLTHTVAFAPSVDDTGNGGGSVKLGWTFYSTAPDPANSSFPDGSESAAFTFDLFPSPGYEVTNISFNLMVGVGSAEGSNESNGYFQVFTRDANYNDNATPFAENLGNPTYDGSNDAGTWESINIPLSPAAQTRAITLQDYSNGINGSETLYIDNLSVTYESVPEPASLGLLSLSIPALLARRRAKKAT